jgi:hypothetical protein
MEIIIINHDGGSCAGVVDVYLLLHPQQNHTMDAQCYPHHLTFLLFLHVRGV